MAADRRVRVGSVRFRITAIAALAVALALTTAGVGVVLAQRRILTDNLEEGIRDAASQVVASTADGSVDDPLPPLAGDDVVAQVTDGSGRILASTRGLAVDGPIAPTPAPGAGATWASVDRLPGQDDPYRILSRRVSTSAGVRVVHVGAASDDIDDATRVLVRSLLVTLPLVVAFVTALVWWLVGRTLRPVEAIRAEVATIEGNGMDRRVPEPSGDDEIARLARTMNDMLERIDRSVTTQRRFVADASHELRSPLTRMRSELEVDAAHPDTADRVRTHATLLEEVGLLQRLVDDLLFLARSDDGAWTPRRDVVDLDDLVLGEAARLREHGGVRIETDAVSAAQVVGDREQLRRLVRNLGDNAARHAGRRVRFSLGEHDGVAVLTVADDGRGIALTDRVRVFERFTRLDDARSRDAGGTGLGLAIARDIVTRHGGEIAVDGDDETTFVVTLPLGPGAAAPSI